MKHTASANIQRLGNDWRLLGRSVFPVGPVSGELTDKWLSETLEPFSVPAGVFDKLKQSLKEAVSRLATSSDSYPIVLRVHISQDMKTDHLSTRNWGFFKLEKTGIPSDEEILVKHLIEYYLYLER